VKHAYPYLIVGGGMAADAAARGIRQVDASGAIGLVGLEPDPPYNRPPLSKGVWKKVRPTPLARVQRGTAALGVDLHLGRRITRIDPALRSAVDDQGDEYSYGELLLATGGDPIQLGPPHERILYYRSLQDYHRLRALLDGGARRFVVVGGGFIGSEMAAALSALDCDVTMIFPENAIGARVLPAGLAQHLNGLFRARGVRVLAGQLVETIEAEAISVSLHTTEGDLLQADAVIAGLGIRPNIELAQTAGLNTANGILVNKFLRSSAPHIYAAGDVVNFYNSTLGQRMRVEHEENANLTGLLAGKAMAGQPEPYQTLPSVYSTLFEITYDAVGDLDPRLEVIYDWQEPFVKGTVYYMKDARVRGVLLWNVPRGLDAARELIAAPGPFGAAELQGRIGG
jgi:NADPH-dependent 2,4-dienoyl-CoA reductase/sulfur reductase-like enzyme